MNVCATISVLGVFRVVEAVVSLVASDPAADSRWCDPRVPTDTGSDLGGDNALLSVRRRNSYGTLHNECLSTNSTRIGQERRGRHRRRPGVQVTRRRETMQGKSKQREESE
jgi:hypothetical protein